MTRSHFLGSCILLLGSAVGCASDPTEDVDAARQAKIIGDKDLTVVSQDGANVPGRYRPLLDAFGILIRGGSAACTVTHIGDGLVLTAGHCFGAPDHRVDDRPCDWFTVRWGVRGPHSILNSQCTRLLVAEYGRERDYAIFRVDEAPRAKVDIDYAARPAIGTTLTMFAHPSGRTLEWAHTCKLHEGVIAEGAGIDEFWHECDTEHGSSGAAMIDDATLKVVGLHTGSRGEPSPFNYGTYLANTPIAEIVGAVSP